jgi:hypothetical protein
MTPEERDIIGKFVARVGGNAPASSAFPGSSSVPSTQPALPPIDPEADRFIADQFSSHPEARYRITQMAFVQEAALAEAQNRIKRLEYDLQQAQTQIQTQQSQPAPSRGILGGLFGGGHSSPPPQPTQYPPGYQPGMFQSGGGSGFLGSALTTAAGVAGGVLAADAISSMFAPHNYGMGGGFGGGGFGGGGFGGGFGGGGFGGPTEVVNETVVNNYGDAGGVASGADPWASGTGDMPAPEPQGDPWATGGDAGGGGDPWATGGDAGGGDPWAGGGDAGGGDAGGGDWGGGGSDDSSF